MTISRVLTVIGLVAVTSACAWATLAGDDVVGLRQADMKAMAAAAKTMADMFRNPVTYSSAEFGKAADIIAAKSGEALAGHFADGLGDPRSKAKQEIRDERARFDSLANDLRDYAHALGAAAKRNHGQMTEQMRMKPGEPMGGGPFGTHIQNEAELSSIPAEHVFHLMLQTCTTCHARFRASQ